MERNATSGGALPRLALQWTVASFAGLLAGVLLGSGAPWGLVFLLVPLAARDVRLVLVALTALSLGVVRERAWAGQAAPLAVWHGATVTVGGYWDGQFLHVRDPRAKLALSPAPAVPRGTLSVRGRLDAPAGRRNPGGFDHAAWLRLQGARDVLYGAVVLRSDAEGGLRGWFRRGLRAGMAPREAALMEALELGDRREVNTLDVGGREAREAFARAGLAHVMALSGQNVALLYGGLGWLLGLLGVGLRRYPLLLLALGVYVWLVGPSPSVVRAALQAGALLLALWVGRGRPDGLGAVGLAGTVSLLLYPAWVFDLGFQLSFLAVLGLLLTPAFVQRLPARWPLWLRAGVAATLLAELATLPVVAHAFGEVPVVGLPANLLAGALLMVLLPLGMVAGALGPLAAPLNVLTELLAGAFLTLVGFFGRAPAVPWGAISPAGFALYAVFALTLTAWLTRRVPGRVLAGVALAGALCTGVPGRLSQPRELVFLDVGQGDSTLLRLGELNVLVDGGGTPRGDFDVGARTVIPALRSMGVHALDVVVATHADADHVEGLQSVLRRMRVGELWVASADDPDAVLAPVLRAARERGVPVREVSRGDTITAGGARLSVLWPAGGTHADDNEGSVALLLETRGFRAALLGDVPQEVEARLGVPPLDLLKVAHHGSRFSTGEALLAQAQPKSAVISVGRNTYGHPSPEVLGRLQAHGVRVHRTDESGAVRVPLP